MGARIVTNVAAFVAVTCVLTIGPGVLRTSNVSEKTIFATATLSSFVTAYLVTLLSGCPFILTPNVNLGTCFTCAIILNVKCG